MFIRPAEKKRLHLIIYCLRQHQRHVPLFIKSAPGSRFVRPENYKAEIQQAKN